MENAAHAYHANQEQFVTLQVGSQRFGIAVLCVRDVLRGLKLTPIPLSPPEIAGSLNLRGRIVTAIDVRARLGLPPLESNKKTMSVVVEHRNDLYSLIVDNVGDVLTIPEEQIEKAPSNIDANWKEIASGVFRLKEDLLLLIDVGQLLKF